MAEEFYPEIAEPGEQIVKSRSQIEVRQDGSEKLSYNYPYLRIHHTRTNILDYSGYGCLSHWHEDVEFLFVEQGQIDYMVNGAEYVLKEGDGFFVNSRQIHKGFTKTRKPGIFICLRFHPIILCESAELERRYVAPIVRNGTPPCVLFDRKNPDARELLAVADQLKPERFGANSELLHMSYMYALWDALVRFVDLQPEQSVSQDFRLSILRSMLSYIGEHYEGKITLQDLCGAGGIGKTNCSRIFSQYTNETPMEYVNSYRLTKAAERLAAGDETITEICYGTGFNSTSYFTEKFRNQFRCTPSEYRSMYRANARRKPTDI